ncbi:MAG: hypothetical protein K8S87_12405 [Planctomycetes bacterium]|nr:hypothetical protein [Planctomycetota bacterium]
MRIKLIITLSFILLLASMLSAAVAKKLSMEFLVENSKVIVHGKVKSLNAAWDKDKKAIWTEIEIEIEKTLKGDAKDTINVYVRGGKVDDIAQEVAGSANFNKNDEVVVFCWVDSEKRIQILGMSQGKFKVFYGNDEEKYAKNSVTGLKLMDDDGKPLDKKNYLPTEMKLTDFLELISKLADKNEKK